MKELLKNNACHMRTTILQYEGNSLLETRTFSFGDSDGNSMGGSLSAYGGQWECECVIAELPDRKETVDLKIRFRLAAGNCQSVGAAVAFEFDQWSTDNYVLMPAAVYNGNRFHCQPLQYPPSIWKAYEYRPDIPVTVTDIPRLSLREGRSCIQQTTGDLSTPAMGFHDPHRGRGFWLLTHQRTCFSNSGMYVEESPDRSKATFTVAVPCVRQMRQGMCGQVPSEDCGIDWEEGEDLVFHIRLHFFASPSVQSLFDRFVEIRRDLSGPVKLQHVLPFSKAFKVIEKKQNEADWVGQYQYYASSAKNSFQPGWVGGCMLTYPLLFAGHEQSQERARANLEMVLAQAQAPSGFFYGFFIEGKWYSDAFPPESHPDNLHMVRKDADLLLFFLKQFMLLRSKNQSQSSGWDAAVRRLADAFVRLWDNYGQFGQYVDIETGNLLVGGSTSAAAAVGALALAGKYFDERRYLAVAEASGRLYYERDLKKGITCGGPGDMLQCPDSESAFAMLESLVILYEVTRGRQWLSAAENVARQCATWCVSYNYTFPPDSVFGKLCTQSTGSVFANAQNKHSSPGICTMSGDCLLKLYRASGNIFYLEMMRDIAHNITQYVACEERPVGPLPFGAMDERLNMGDWEGTERIGKASASGYWPEVSALLTYVEVPGLYVQPDRAFIFTIDHIDAKLLDCSDGQAAVRIVNPTAHDASVRVLVESLKQTTEPLGFNALFDCPCVTIRASEQKEFVFGLRK